MVSAQIASSAEFDKRATPAAILTPVHVNITALNEVTDNVVNLLMQENSDVITANDYNGSTNVNEKFFINQNINDPSSQLTQNLAMPKLLDMLD